jgi:hypothetical protein
VSSALARAIALTALLLVPVQAAASSLPRTLRLISGGTASLDALPNGVAADGSRVWFTTAEALVTADTNGVADVYERRVDGGLDLISFGNGAATFLGASADGTRVWFSTAAADAGAGDADTAADVYERRGDGALRLISAGTLNTPATFVGAAADGSVVLFRTAEPLVAAGDGDGAPDVFARAADGLVTLATPGTASAMTVAAVSLDGTRLVISTTEPLVPSDLGSTTDLYAFARGAATPVLLSAGTAGSPVLAAADPTLSKVVFATTAAMLPADVDGVNDLYQRGTDGTLRLLTPGTTGSVAFAGASAGLGRVYYLDAGRVVAALADGTSRLITPGTTVAVDPMGPSGAGASFWFLTTESLVPADPAGTPSLYRVDDPGGYVLLSPGSTALAVTASLTPASVWSHVLFAASDLVGTGDADGVDDVYIDTPTGPELISTGTGAIAGLGGSGAFASPVAQTPDGSRVLFATPSAVTGLGDTDGSVDVYESDWAVPEVATAPSVIGTIAPGATVTCGGATFNGDGVTASTRWFLDGVATGTTGATRVLGDADLGHALSCVVAGANPIGSVVAPSVPVAVPPVFAAPPRVNGAPVVGSSITCQVAGKGQAATTFTWLRDGTPITGAGAATYRLVRADAGHRVACRVVLVAPIATATGTSASLRLPARCVVPRVRGLSLTRARAVLAAAGCGVGPVRRAPGAGVARGRVLRSSPVTGRRIANGTRVGLTLRR